jgi:hypothetical protein
VTRTHETARVVRAFAYLRAMSLVNAVRSRLRRLKQPKYLVGGLVMGGYVGMMLLATLTSQMTRPPVAGAPAVLALFSGLAALFVLVAVATAWLLPGDRAALEFSEAEVAFLFPAPLTRVALINFSLLRSQVAIFVSAFLLSVVFGRGRGLPGNAWQHATALWLIMATLRLHLLGASFVHERWFEAGWHPWARRLAGGLALLIVIGGLVAWVAGHVAPPRAEDLADGQAFGLWLRPVLATPPAGVVLAPFHWLVAPLFTGGAAGWLRSLLPAFALLALHYLWVVRSHVAFEEAAIDRARKRAERVQAFREGRPAFRLSGNTAQVEPFALAPRGPAPVAFLWQGLIAAGPAGRARNVAILVAVLALVIFGLAQTPWAAAVDGFRYPFLLFAAMVPFAGTMAAQRSLRDTLDRLEILKAMPLPGWQLAIGQLLTPVLFVVALQWLFLLASAMATVATGHSLLQPLPMFLALVVPSPALAMLVLCLPFGAMLLFPAWAGAISSRGGGFEVAGQRILFGLFFLLGLMAITLPAALIGGGLWLLFSFVFQWPGVALFVGSLAVTAVLAAELWLVLRSLGHRIDRFDVSIESR